MTVNVKGNLLGGVGPAEAVARRGDAGACHIVEFRPEAGYIDQFNQKGRFMAVWPVQNAKTHLSTLIARACSDGPQTITWHGAPRAVVLSIEDFKALEAHKPDFKAYLLGGPKVDDFSIARDGDPGRDLGL